MYLDAILSRNRAMPDRECTMNITSFSGDCSEKKDCVSIKSINNISNAEALLPFKIPRVGWYPTQNLSKQHFRCCYCKASQRSSICFSLTIRAGSSNRNIRFGFIKDVYSLSSTFEQLRTQNLQPYLRLIISRFLCIFQLFDIRYSIYHYKISRMYDICIIFVTVKMSLGNITIE